MNTSHNVPSLRPSLAPAAPSKTAAALAPPSARKATSTRSDVFGDLPVIALTPMTGAKGTQKGYSLGVVKPGQMGFFTYELPPLEKGEFRVKLLYSGLSAGTEGTFFKGTNPFLTSELDPKTHLFVPSSPTKVAESQQVPFLGYEEVVQVTESRSDIGVKKGDILAIAVGHRTTKNVKDSDKFIKLPKDLDPLLGVFAYQMGPIAAQAVLRAEWALAAKELGEDPVKFAQDHVSLLQDPNGWAKQIGTGLKGKHVLVSGAGVVGMMVAAMAKYAGADVAIVDTAKQRLDLAEKFGLKTVLVDPKNPQTEGVDTAARWAKITSGWQNEAGDVGADLVIEASGFDKALDTAIKAVTPQSPTLAVGFYQGGAPNLELGKEFHHNGGQIIDAQIGNLLKSVTKAQLSAFTIEFLKDPRFGKLIGSEFITDVVPLKDGQKTFERSRDRDPSLYQAVFKA